MKISIELNEQELDIVLGGLENLKELLFTGSYIDEAAPVQNLMTRIIDAIEQAEGSK
jgi:hypothetical protein